MFGNTHAISFSSGIDTAQFEVFDIPICHVFLTALPTNPTIEWLDFC